MNYFHCFPLNFPLDLDWILVNVKGVENVYTQHQPVLAETIENAVKGKLKDLDYPFIGQQFQQGK